MPARPFLTLSPEALALALRDTGMSLREAARIGPACQTLVETPVRRPGFDQSPRGSRGAAPEKSHGAARLEAPARGAALRHRPLLTVSPIPLPAAAPVGDPHAQHLHQGGRFCRDLQTLFPH